jgi:hypothetical protein
MQWVVIVREPASEEAVAALPKRNGKPETMEMWGAEWFVFARRTCVIEVEADSRRAVDAKWGKIYIIPTKE